MTNIAKLDLDKNGFFYKQIIEKAEINKLLILVYKQFNIRSGSPTLFDALSANNNAHQAMLDLRQNDPGSFSLIYDSVYNSAYLHQFLT
jgi:hypothetical protein